MKASPNPGPQLRAVLKDEVGLTLIELLVSMLLGFIVIGAATYGLAQAFQQNTEVVDHARASGAGGVGLERLILDLRQAANGSCGSTGQISGVMVNQDSTGAVTTLSMCAQTGVPLSYTTTVATGTVTSAGLTTSLVPEVWICNTGTSSYTSGSVTVSPETCARSINGVGSTSFHGVVSFALSGLVNGATTPTVIQTAGATNIYTLNPTVATGQTGTLSWVGISIQLADLKNPGNPSEVSVVTASRSTPVHTGTGLLNYGT